MKFISYVFFLLLISTIVVANETTPQFPHKDFKIKFIYKLDNGNTIYVEPTGMNDAVWELNRRTGLFTKKAIVWNFIALAKKCETVDESNIYFAQNKEYYLGGGIDENPTIRIFSLNNKHPWRDSDLGIVPNMKWTKQWCVFYDNN